MRVDRLTLFQIGTLGLRLYIQELSPRFNNIIQILVPLFLTGSCLGFLIVIEIFQTQFTLPPRYRKLLLSEFLMQS